MAILQTYPIKTTLNKNDLLVITDQDLINGEISNKTRSIRISTISGVDSLNSLKGDINITGGTNITVTPSGQNIEISNSSSGVDGSGTAGKIPMWSDSNTLTNSQFESNASGVLDIPNYIRHVGDTGNFFGFGSTAASSEFLVYTEGSGSPLDQESLRIRPSGTAIKTNATTRLNTTVAGAIELYYAGSKKFETRTDGVELSTGNLFIPGYITHLGDSDSFFGFSGPNNFILETDSGRKIAAGPSGVTLYSDTSTTATTTSVARFATDTTGAIVYGQTIAAGAASERGGIIRYYNNANDRYVGISGPVTQGTSYQVRLPDSVGTAGQVLKLNTPIIGGSTQDLTWGDAAIYTAGTNIAISGTNVISSTDTTYTASTGIVLTGTVFSANISPITQTIPANNFSTTLARTYRVQANSSGEMVVNVPWTSSSSNLTAGTGLTLTGTVFSANTFGTQGSMANVSSNVSGRSYVIQTGTANGATGSDNLVVNVPWTDTVTSLTTTGTGAATLISGVLDIPTVTVSQGLTSTSNNITLDIADPTNGWAILGGGAGSTTPVIFGSAGANAVGTKNFGISTFINSSSVTTADQNVSVGFNSMGLSVSTASRNVAVGFETGSSMTIANDCVLVGFDAGKGITDGDENTIIGSNAGETITTGNKNTIIGSLAAAVDGAASLGAVAIGRNASATTKSVAVGTGATVTGATGTAIGEGTSVTAANGIAIGQGCSVSGPVLGLASASNPIQITTLTEPNIEEYLTVVVNGVTRYIALYSGTP